MVTQVIRHIASTIIIVTFFTLLLPAPATFALRPTQEGTSAQALGNAFSTITPVDDNEESAGYLISFLRKIFEQQRALLIERKFKGHAWHPSLATWFHATRKTIETLYEKVTVYYPGAGSDILYPLLATDGDIFIFVDLYTKSLPKTLILSVIKNGGRILKIRRGIIRRNEYYLEFFIFGKRKELYYYCGVNAAKEVQLPKRVKDGFNVYIERRVAEGYGNVDASEILPLSLKYLSDKGFTITDYRISQFPGRANLFQIGYTHYKEIYSFNFYLKPHIDAERILIIDITNERAEAIKEAVTSKRTLLARNIYAIAQPQPGQTVDEVLRQKYGEVPNIDYVFNNSKNAQLAFGPLANKVRAEFGHIEDTNEAAEKITTYL